MRSVNPNLRVGLKFLDRIKNLLNASFYWQQQGRFLLAADLQPRGEDLINEVKREE